MASGYETHLTHEVIPDYWHHAAEVPVVEYWDVYRQHTRKAYHVSDIPCESFAALPHEERVAIRKHLPA